MRSETPPRWSRPALVALLLATAILYLWGLSASGWANSFYSAAVQAGSQSWEAFFFGSSDAGNSITVDKPPASLWVMALSVRIFGLSSWSILVPQALMGVASVGILHGTVRRTATSRLGPRSAAFAGLLAGAVLAITPVATLMFRFNNPDALLVLLMTTSAALTLRSIRTGKARWLVWAGVAIGFGFLTKQLQAFLVVPGLVIAYAVCAPHRWWPRVRHLALAGLALVVSAGWWVTAVALTPAADRPYVGGSQHNSIIELTLGYNGLGRLTGDETGSVGGGGPSPQGGGGMWGTPSLTRLFGAEMGGQIAWLLPAALLLLAVGLILTHRAARHDIYRAALIAWGLWTIVTGLTFSLMAGIIHPYYMVALAPSIAALVGLGIPLAWRHRGHWWASLSLGVVSVTTGVTAFVLLARTPQWCAWLRHPVLVVSIVAAAGLVGSWHWRRARPKVAGRLAAGAGALGLLAALAAPAAVSAQTVSTAHHGSIVSAGPQASGRFGPGGHGGPARAGAGGPGSAKGLPPGGQRPTGGTPTQGTPPQGAPPGGGGQPQRATGAPPSSNSTSTTTRRGRFGPEAAGGMGGLLDSATPGTAMVAALKKDSDSFTWVAATVGANNAAGYQLATGEPVMPIGGFNGTDPSPTLAAFKTYVRRHKIHYFIVGGSGPGGGANSTSGRISDWVTSHFTATTIGGTTVYDLTR